MKKSLLLVIMFLVIGQVGGQDEKQAQTYAETISKDDLHDYLSILASDALEGRETGSRGQKMAAALISDHFKKIGLQGPVNNGSNNPYYQPLTLYKSIPGDIYVTVREKKFRNFEDIVYYGSSNNGFTQADVIFAGKGSARDFDAVNIHGKSAMIVVNDIRSFQAPAELAKSKGVTHLFVVSETDPQKFNEMAEQFKHWLGDGRLAVEKPTVNNESEMGIIFVSPGAAEEIFNTPASKLKDIANDTLKKANLKKVKPAKVTINIEQQIDTVESENVLGYLEGTDKKDEVIVITAHYDHIGKKDGKINNGADDDGSGTSAVMEIAEAFAMAAKDGYRPRRSVLFMLVTGEEKGLLGSEYYAKNPIFPLENTITNLNIDMIGRIDPAHKNNPDYVYLVGSDRLSSELHEISEQVNKAFSKLDLDYTYNDENHPERIYYRSDHWNFAKNNVPIIFYFNGVHEDYHKPTDTIEKINFDILTKRSRFVFYTAWVLANREERPLVDKLDLKTQKKD